MQQLYQQQKKMIRNLNKLTQYIKCNVHVQVQVTFLDFMY